MTTISIRHRRPSSCTCCCSLGAQIPLIDRETAADGPELAARLRAGTCDGNSRPRRQLGVRWSNRTGGRARCARSAVAKRRPGTWRTSCYAGRGAWNLYGPTETTIWSTVAGWSPSPAPVTVDAPSQIRVSTSRFGAIPSCSREPWRDSGIGGARRSSAITSALS